MTTIGQSTGTIEVAGDGDWFKVQLTAGTEYVFDVSGTLTSPEVSLYDSSGNLLVTGTDASVAGDARTSFEPTTSGTYYVGASSQTGATTGAYTVAVSTSTYDYAGTINTTGTVSVGSHVSGALTTIGQNDWFKVQLTAGTEYSFTVGSGTLGAPLVTLYDSTGKEIVSGNDGGTIDGTATAFMPTTSGVYYVGVGGQLSSTGTFTLSVANVAASYASNATTTGVVSVGGTSSGTIGAVGQSEWFKVQLTAGTEYVFDVGNGSLSTPEVTLYDASGDALVVGTSGGASGGARTSFTPTTSGTYYVAASGYLSTTGTFTVGVSTASYDFAGNVNTTGTVAVGGQTSGNLTTVGQSDWFKVQLTAGTEYVFSAGNGTLANPTVTLYDSSGHALVSGSGSSSAAVTSFIPTTSGTYYVGAAGSQPTSTGSFTVGVTTAHYDYAGNTNTTGVVSVGSHVSDAITTVGQSEWFKVQLTAGTQYVFDVGSGSLASPEVTLYDSSGHALVSGTTGGTGAETSFTPTTTGTYYVGASSQTTGTGSFTVAVSTATDDYSGSTTTTGVIGSAPYSAAAEVVAYQQGQLTQAAAVSDSAANVQANLDGLEAIAKAGLLSSITLTDTTTPTITVSSDQVAADAAAIKAIAGSYALSVTGFSAGVSHFVSLESGSYVPGTTHSGTDQVVGFVNGTVTFTSGTDAVVLDGARSEYSIKVDATGATTIIDTATNQTMHVTGESYLIFSGASVTNHWSGTSPGPYDSMYFVDGSASAQMAQLYNAAFQRQPDLLGLEYWQNNHANGMSLTDIANGFLVSNEFTQTYGTVSSLSDTQYVTLLYENVLHRAPDPSGLSYWLSDLSGGDARANVLLDFSASVENIDSANSWLINPTDGGYADSGVQFSAQTVLTQVSQSGYLNTNLIDPTTVQGSVVVNGLEIDVASGQSTGSLTVTSSASPGLAIFLSSGINSITVNTASNTIVDSSSNSTIVVNAANNSLMLSHGGIDTVNLMGGSGTSILGFTPGSGSSLDVANTTTSSALQILDGTSSAVDGSGLSFGNGTYYIVNIGNVGDGSAASVASAANAAYKVGDISGASTPAGTGEYLTFMGKDNAGDTVLWLFGSNSGATNGVIPTSSLANSADTNSNHLVDANEIVHLATLVGVQPSSLSVYDLA
ncbi:DUF4214 domain-containing protein [Telmatospirillum sp.]|uniref:DUF4214 domain-containing protein n=1 Tax=Telmatospirillum sp. TaxID=2079197 RepID=UPI002845BB3F|nr:DUF4214 domain-containing protein [Telmatospirillum sp.]MDR3441040.1 DUF4214 domain-containing protein [Telmatospirillum sp.]